MRKILSSLILAIMFASTAYGTPCDDVSTVFSASAGESINRVTAHHVGSYYFVPHVKFSNNTSSFYMSRSTDGENWSEFPIFTDSHFDNLTGVNFQITSNNSALYAMFTITIPYNVPGFNPQYAEYEDIEIWKSINGQTWTCVETERAEDLPVFRELGGCEPIGLTRSAFTWTFNGTLAVSNDETIVLFGESRAREKLNSPAHYWSGGGLAICRKKIGSGSWTGTELSNFNASRGTTSYNITGTAGTPYTFSTSDVRGPNLVTDQNDNWVCYFAAENPTLTLPRLACIGSTNDGLSWSSSADFVPSTRQCFSQGSNPQENNGHCISIGQNKFLVAYPVSDNDFSDSELEYSVGQISSGGSVSWSSAKFLNNNWDNDVYCSPYDYPPDPNCAYPNSDNYNDYVVRLGQRFDGQISAVWANSMIVSADYNKANDTWTTATVIADNNCSGEHPLVLNPGMSENLLAIWPHNGRKIYSSKVDNGTPILTPNNDEKAGAFNISCGYSVNGIPITTNATPSSMALPPNCDQANDVWYHITVPEDPNSASVGQNLSLAFDDDCPYDPGAGGAGETCYVALYKKDPYYGTLSLVDYRNGRYNNVSTIGPVKVGAGDKFYIRLASNSPSSTQSFSVSCFSKLQ